MKNVRHNMNGKTKIKNEMARIGRLLAEKIDQNNSLENYELYELKGQTEGLVFALNAIYESEALIEGECEDLEVPNNANGNYLEDRNDR